MTKTTSTGEFGMIAGYAFKRARLIALAGIMSLALTGCISLGTKPPDSLLTLSSTATAPAGSSASAGQENAGGAIAVLAPETPAKLNVLRLPVQVSATEIAYLPDTFWVDRPSRLFRRLLGETLRTRSNALILDGDDTPAVASQYVRGTLLDMTYDAPTSSVVVRFDAIRTNEDGTAISRRFEARESGVLAEPASVGPAMNRVANTVAGEVADWVISTP